MKLAEMRTQAVESLGMEPGFELELDNGETVVVPNPLLAPDGVTELVADNKPIEAARLLLGDADHAKLLANGGHSNDAMLAWQLMRKDIEDDSKSDGGTVAPPDVSGGDRG